MKLFKKIYAILMTFIFIFVLVGFANKVSAADTTITFAQVDLGSVYESSSSSTTEHTFTKGDVSFGFTGIKTKSGEKADKDYGYIMMMGGQIYNTSAPTDTFVKSVKVTYTSGTGVSGKISINFGSSAIKSRATTGGTAPTKGGNLTVSNENQDNCYFNISNSTTSNTQISSVEVVFGAKVNKVLTGIAASGSVTKTNYFSGDSFDPSGLTVKATYDDESNADITSAITWTPSVLTAGTTEVTGTYTEGGVTKTVTVTGLTVVDYVPHAGTLADPLNVKDALDIIDENEGELTDGSYYVKGIISEAPTLNYGMLTFYIKDDLTDTNKLQCYNIAKSDGTYTQDDCDSLKVGYEVVVYGKMKKYYSTYEIDGSAGANLDSVTYPQYSATYHYNNGDADQVVQSSASTGKFIEPEDPTKTGYLFGGWYSNEGCTNEFDFEKYATANVDIYAKWNSQLQDDLNAIDSYMTMAYSYDTDSKIETLTKSLTVKTDSTATADFGKDITHLFDSVYDFSIVINKNNSSNFWVKTTDIRLYKGSGNGGEMIITPKDATIKSYKINGSSDYEYASLVDGTLKIKNTSDDKIVITSIEITYEKSVFEYSNVDFRLKVAVDDILSIIDDVDSYGISLTAGTTEIKLTGDKLHEDTDKLYSIVDLGDVINTNSRASTTFTVKAYVTVGDETYYSTSEKEYSVVDMVEVYYNMGGEVKTQVSGLYNYFASQGLYD